MNTTTIEGLIVVRDQDNKIVAILNRIEGEQKYEIYSTTIMAVDELVNLLNNKIEEKI